MCLPQKHKNTNGPLLHLILLSLFNVVLCCVASCMHIKKSILYVLIFIIKANSCAALFTKLKIKTQNDRCGLIFLDKQERASCPRKSQLQLLKILSFNLFRKNLNEWPLTDFLFSTIFLLKKWRKYTYVTWLLFFSNQQCKSVALEILTLFINLRAHRVQIHWQSNFP